MTLSPPLMATLQALEQALLHTDFREDPSQLERLLAPDFVEVNPMGMPTDRQAVVAWLLAKNPQDRWQFSEWQLEPVGPGAILVRYHAVRTSPASTSKGARHVSLWRQTSAGSWQLCFHQSTKVLQASSLSGS